MTTNLIIVCGGGHAVDILDIINNATEEFNVVGWVDDRHNFTHLGNLERHFPSDFNGKHMYGCFGPLTHVAKAMVTYSDLQYVVAINSSRERERIDNFISQTYFLKAANIIHKTASLSTKLPFGHEDGLVMGPFSSVGPGVRLGRGVHINTGASINQSSKIGAFTTISPGARICGDVELGEAVQVGAGVVVANTMCVAHHTILGAGAVVTNHLQEPETTYVGVPAKPIVYTTEKVNPVDINV